MERLLRLYLIRHGETEANVKSQVCGQMETPLTSRGVEQARLLAQYIAVEKIAPDFFFTSSLGRAKATHELVFPGQSAEVVAAFNETDTGSVSEWSFTQLHEFEPRFRQQGVHSDLRYPHGESISEVYARMSNWIESTVFAGRFPSEKSVAIVGHGGTVNSFLHFLLQVPLRQYPAFPVGNARLVEVVVDLNDRLANLVRYNVPVLPNVDRQ